MSAIGTVSKVTAARLAEKYPQFAAVASEAIEGEIVVCTSSGMTDRAPAGTVLSRQRKYTMPGGSVVVLDEVDAPAPVVVAPVVEADSTEAPTP